MLPRLLDAIPIGASNNSTCCVLLLSVNAWAANWQACFKFLILVLVVLYWDIRTLRSTSTNSDNDSNFFSSLDNLSFLDVDNTLISSRYFFNSLFKRALSVSSKLSSLCRAELDTICLIWSVVRVVSILSSSNSSKSLILDCKLCNDEVNSFTWVSVAFFNSARSIAYNRSKSFILVSKFCMHLVNVSIWLDKLISECNGSSF